MCQGMILTQTLLLDTMVERLILNYQYTECMLEKIGQSGY